MISWRRVFPIATVLSASLLTASIASAQVGSLTTGYVWDSGWAAGAFFDVRAAVPLNIAGFGSYFKGTLNRNVSIYYKAGTSVGSEMTPGAWTLLGTVNVTPGGDGTLTALNLGGVVIPAGQTFGFYIFDNLGTGGVDGGGQILDMNPPPNHSNADMTITSHVMNHTAFGETQTDWGWQGTVYYEANPEAVPALGTTALAGLAALLLLLGWSVLRQRSAT